MITPTQGQEMLNRLERNRKRCAIEPSQWDGSPPPAKRPAEGKLHKQIMDWADKQWPPVKYIHSRMDEVSTIQVGCQDFSLFMPQGRMLLIECKKIGEKPDAKQRIWHKELEILGHKVHTITTFEQFLALVENKAGQV